MGRATTGQPRLDENCKRIYYKVQKDGPAEGAIEGMDVVITIICGKAGRRRNKALTGTVKIFIEDEDVDEKVLQVPISVFGLVKQDISVDTAKA